VYYVVLGSPAESAGLLPGDVILRVDTKGDTNKVVDPGQVNGILRELAPQESIRLHVTRFGDKQIYGVTLEQLPSGVEFKKVRSRVWPGFSVVKLTGAIASRLEMPRVPGSFVIGRVEVGSPAFISGLRTGDIISTIEGVTVNDFEEFYRFINNSDTSLSIRIYRRGQSGEVELSKTSVATRSEMTE
jgi:S1-C subfamily serine protease